MAVDELDFLFMGVLETEEVHFLCLQGHFFHLPLDMLNQPWKAYYITASLN